MASNTYTNAITEREVSIALEQILIADTTQTWTPGRIDVGSPPAGFTHLGAVVEDSPNLSISREKFELRTGIPSVLQFDAVTGMSGQFSAAFYSNSNIIAAYGLGADVVKNSVGTINVNTATADSASEMTITGSGVFAVDDIVAIAKDNAASTPAVATIVDLQKSTIIRKVTAVETLSADKITFDVALDFVPTVKSIVAKLEASKVVFGTTKNPRYALLGVADFLDGSQVIHYFKKVAPVGEFSENIQPGQPPIISGAWTMFSAVDTNWGSEQVLGERFWIPKSHAAASFSTAPGY